MKSILGQEGDFDGEDGVRIVVSQDELPRFLCRKWFRFFICDEPEPSDELIQPLATTLAENDLHVAPVLQQMLASNLFFSEHSVGRKIKSPVELVVGLLRCLGATANTQVIASGLRDIGQGLFYPPNVKGWDGGRAWINSSTLLGRVNLVNRILNDSTTRFGGMSLTEYLDRFGVGSAEEALEHFEMCFLTRSISMETRRRLIDNANDFGGNQERAYRGLLHSFASLPEFQLA